MAEHLASMPTLVLDQAVAHGGERGLGVLKQRLSASGLHKRIGREYQGMPVENGFDGLEPIIGQAQPLLEIEIVHFNGLIANDKFCLSRTVQLSLTWSRRPLRCREQNPSDRVYSGDEQVHHGGAYETSLDCSTHVESGSGRRIPLGSSVPTPSAMDLTFPTDTKFGSITSPGGV